MAPLAIVAIINAPAAIGRVISAQTVAAKRQRRPQLRASKPPCGSSQTAAATASGTIQRQGDVIGAPMLPTFARPALRRAAVIYADAVGRQFVKRHRRAPGTRI